jgi:signal transduction histidine kinase
MAEIRLSLRQRSLTIQQVIRTAGFASLQVLDRVSSLGLAPAMDEFEKRKLRIFNQLNFYQLITGVIVPVAGLLYKHSFPWMTWFVAGLPVLISILVLWLNSRFYYQVALIAYFALYPFATSIVYFSGADLGVELSFILYGILSVFFLQEISQMLFALGWTMVSYFVLAVVCKNYTYQLASANIFFYLFNQILAIVFIFYGLFLIKKENTGYQHSILRQKETLAENEKLLQLQTQELKQLNGFKNRLFSIIAHDLKSPIYALRNLFGNMQEYDLPADEIKNMVPDVVNELTHTSNLMENLLQWARSQMHADSVKPQPIDVSELIQETVRLLRLQAEAKKVRVDVNAGHEICAFADKDMINLVIRNLLSNAIKYTPEKGSIHIGARRTIAGVEVFVQDSGTGISSDALHKINLSNYYTTKGTAGESGTGLGLMLCRDFLGRNNGKLRIESEPGKGSLFTCLLPDGE